MAMEFKAGIDHAAFVKDVEKGMRAANRSLSKRANTLKLKLDDKGFRQPLGRITGDLNMFDSALAASNARVIAFGASTAVIGGISKAFKELAKTTVEVGKQFADINRILSLSNKNFEKFGNRLFEISKKNATSFQDTTKAALEFARQGLKTEETLKRTADALTLVRLTGINADKAVSSLTATVNAFDSAMVTTTTAVNKFVAVETKFAVGARDLVEAVGRVGSSALDAKVGFDELNAMVTSVQQTTGRGGAVIGNAMKTIFTRLQRQSTLEALESYNVAVRDVQGNTLPAMHILDNFAKSYAGLADASQGYLREQVAGVFQANILSAILKDLNKQQSTYSSALDTSTNATDEANQATAELNKTLAALAEQTGLEFKRLQANIGKATFEPIAREILAPLKDMMKGINDVLDGEGAGSDIANGLLKGLRNILGGPGLIAAIGLIGKVFLNTTSYMLKSLPALAGITTETQKRAALEQSIETILQREQTLAMAISGYEGDAAHQASLLANYAELAANDMERQSTAVTNIANKLTSMPKGALNVAAVTKGKTPRGASGFIPGMAGEIHDIQRGVGGVSRSSKPVSIPNFSFGGGMRGTMIANTGEYMVPNFKGGGSAIFNPNMVAQFGMPTGAKPIRGAGGYVPNFADLNRADAMRELEGMRKYGRGYSQADLTRTRGIAGMFGITGKNLKPGSVKQRIERGGKKKTVKGTFLNATTKAHMLVPQAGFRSENYPYIFGQGSALQKLAKTHTKKDVDGMILSGYGPSLGATKEAQKGGRLAKVEDVLDNALVKAAESVIMAYSPALATTPVSKKKVEGTFLKEGGHGAMGAFKGALFEAIVSRLIGQKYEKGAANTSTLDVLLSGRAGKNAEELFGITQTAATHADVKSSWSSGNRAKIAEQIIKNFKGGIPTTTGASRGYIPNFAALGDSVEREVAAGVPLGSIRVGRSSRLAGPNNPAGLGITNTRDEPRGLKDVVGASRGYVPNYFIGTGGGLFGGRSSASTPMDVVAVELKGIVKRTAPQFAKLETVLAGFTKELMEGKIDTNQYSAKVTKAGIEVGKFDMATRRGKQQMTMLSKRAGQAAGNVHTASGAATKTGTGMGGMMFGMGLSMGLPMLAGAAEQAGVGRDTTGAMTAAGTGASIGMMAGPWGAAAGAAVGALGSLASSAMRVGARMDELEKEFTEFEKTSKEQDSAARNIIKAQEEINNPSSADALKAAQIALKENFEKIKGTELEKDFKNAGENVDAMTVALKSFTSGVVAERTGRQTIREAAKFRFRDQVVGRSNNNMAFTSELSRPTTGSEEGIQKRNKALMMPGWGPESQKAFVDNFGEFFSLMKLSKTEARGISGLATGGYRGDKRGDSAALARKFIELRPEIFEDMFMDEGLFKTDPRKARSQMFKRVESLFKGDDFTKSLKNLPTILDWINLDELEKAAKEAEDEAAYKKMKQLEESLTNINKNLDVSINAVKDTTLMKFKDAFVKLNSALSNIGGDIRTVLGDEVGAARFRAGTVNRQRYMKDAFTRQDFGIKQQSKLRSSFKGAFPQGKQQLGAYEEISQLLLTDPAKAMQMLRVTTGPRSRAPGIAGALQRRAAPNMGVFGKTPTELPKAQEFRNAVMEMLRAYDIQEENIKAEEVVVTTKQRIEEIKAKNLVQERDIAKLDKLNLTKRENVTKLEEMRLQHEISMMQKRSQDPARARGLTIVQNQERLFNDQRDVLQKQIALDQTRIDAENTNLKVQLDSQTLLIKANLALVGADEELKDATNKLAVIMAGQALGAQFDKGGEFAIDFIKGGSGDAALGSSPSIPPEKIRQMYIDQNLERMGFKGGQFSASGAGRGGAAANVASIQKQINQLEKQYTQEVKNNNTELAKRIKDKKELLELEIEIGMRETKRDTDFMAGLQEGFNTVYQDIDQIYNRLGKDLPTQFREGMVNALEVSLDKAESFGDAMRGVAVDMLKMIRHASLMHSMSNFTSLIGMGASKDFRNSGGFQSGSLVPGTGTGDKIPYMLEAGEYVMNRKAVQGVGKSNLDQINFGSFPRFGGAQTGGGTMFLNEKYSSDKMSGFYLASDNPELMEAREKAREAYQKEQEKRAEKKSLRNAFLSTLASAGVGKLMSMGASAWKNRGLTKEGKKLMTGKLGTSSSFMQTDPSNPYRQMIGSGKFNVGNSTFDMLPATGGPAAGASFGNDPRFGGGPPVQKGGHIGAGFTNRDSVPAYMAGGEFVMNNRAVRKYGLGYMGRLNGGLIPAMQTGGAVGAEAAPLNAQTSANTNNISINVNVGGGEGGSGQGASSSTGNQNASEQSNEDRATQGKELGEKIRGAVLEVIQTEQRLGGSLSSSARKP